MGIELARAVVRIEGDIHDLDAALSLVGEKMGEAGKSLDALGKDMMLKITLPLLAIGTLAVKEFGQQEDAVARLNAVLAASGHVSGQTTEGIVRMADAMQDVTRFDNDAVVASAALLATFHSVRNEMGAGNDVFDRSIHVAADLAATMGTDLQEAVTHLGRALEQPATGLMLLRRAGIQFDPVEQQQIKSLVEHNHLLEAQRIILDKVEGKVRGVAAAMAQTPMGQFVQAWNAVKDALKPVGQVLDQVLVPLAGLVREVANAFKAMSPEVVTVVVVLGGIVAAIPVIITALAAFLKGLAAVRAALLLYGLTIGAIAIPIALALAAIALFTFAGVKLWQNWDTIKLKLTLVWEEIEAAVLTVIARILDALSNLPGAVGEAFASAADEVKTKLRKVQHEIIATKAAIQKDLLSAGDVPGTKPPSHKIKDEGPKDTLSPESRAAVVKALEDLNQQLHTNITTAAQLGDAFDKTSADAKATAATFDTLSKIVGVDMATKLTTAGLTLRAFGKDLAVLQAQAFGTDLNHQLDLIDRGLGGATEKANVFLQKMREFVAMGPEERAAATAAGNGLDELRDKFEKLTLKAAIGDFFRNEIGTMVDALDEGSQKFTDFVVNMLHQLALLILKMELLNLIGGIGHGKVGKFLGLPGFAAGGFLSSGQVGLVGEAGPELVQAGRTGATIQPLSQARGTAPEGGGTQMLAVTVHNHVSAIDQKGVVQFFDENQGLVGASVLKAVQRSRLLRQGLS